MPQGIVAAADTFISSQQDAMVSSWAEKLATIGLRQLFKKLDRPFSCRSMHGKASGQIVQELLDSVLDRADENFVEVLLPGLARHIALQSGYVCNPDAGVDIEMERDGKRYLIAVKSGKAWGDATQHKKLRENFASAVRVLRQSKHVGEIQPTLGICYGRFKQIDNGNYLHIGGKDFWELISGEPDLYMDIIEPIGYRAKELNDAFHEKRDRAMNRMVREFTERFCMEDGSIDWPKIVTLVSDNIAS
jgi:hypothetical protein